MESIRLVKDHFRAMNTDIEVNVADRGLDADRNPFEDIRSWFSDVESRFSRFLPHSELSWLNASRGFPTRISAIMQEVLTLAAYYRRITHGIYEPSILQALLRAGYGISFEKMERDSSEARSLPTLCPSLPKLKPSELRWTIYPSLRIARISRGTLIDLSGVVKGWAVDRMTNRLMSKGIRIGQLNAGGDLRVWGDSDSPAWEIDIESPWAAEGEESTIIATASIKQGAAATSGIIKRSWQTAEGSKHHLIDPRTGQPSASNVIQCTVIGASAADAEIAAKTICILGYDEGKRWMKQSFPADHALLIMKNGTTDLIRGESTDIHWKGVE
jgi:thiamine biosynthesis lipoprotein